MANNDKVMIGKSGDWVRVREDHGDTVLSIGEDGETNARIDMSDWEAFQVIQKLAEVSGLFLDKTGAQGLIISRPENPREEERREELADQFSNGEWKYKDLPDSTQRAIEFVLTEEIKEGKL